MLRQQLIHVEALSSQQPKLKSMFMKRHVLSMREFSREEIDSVLDLAASLEPYARGRKSDMMAGKILALLFFEPSTRTRMSFEAAMKRLGGSVINLGPAEGSSISKGESLADTVRVVAGYSDALSAGLLSGLRLGIASVAGQLLPAPTS
jgi:aspartate carbamoyltransferase catalytic subunit